MSKVKQAHALKDPSILKDLPILGKAPKSEKEEQYLREFGEYEFYNIEEQGTQLEFTYGNTKNYHKFLFEHSKNYKIPRHVARHVESRSTPIWGWRPNGKGQLEKELLGMKPRFQMRAVFSE